MSEASASLPGADDKKSKTQNLTDSGQRTSVSFRFTETSFKPIDYDEDKVNIVRFNCMQSWFLASSQKTKDQFLSNLLNRTTPKSLLILLNTLDCRRDKTIAYATAHQATNFMHDKSLNDHNRALERGYLEETIKADLDWYETLNEARQLDVIFELLKLGGGVLIRNTFHKALSIYHQIQRSVKKTKQVKNVSEVHQKLIPSDDPSEVEKARKKWGEAINKYRASVEGGNPSKKTGKKGGEQGEENQFLIDQVQLLPVWIVKQIFSYLDQKTLLKIKNVNRYWAYVVDDLLKEKVTQKYIDRTLKKIQIDMDPVAVEALREEENETRSKLSRISASQKRLQKLAFRGAVHPKLRTIEDAPTFQKSLITDATAKKKSQYIVPVDKLQPFPRNIPVDGSLHRNTSCVLNEASEFIRRSSASTQSEAS